MSLAPYPKYRPSGIEWLGEVPEHWEVKPLVVLVENRESKVAEVEGSTPLPYVGLDQIESWTSRLMRIDPDFEPSASSNRFEPGDILYGKLRPYLAKVCRVDFEGMCSSDLLALRPVPEVDDRFLCYFLLTDGFTSWMNTCSYGTKMPRTSWVLMKRCAAAVPKIDEQRSIAEYLDGETVKLDAVVRKQRTLIERLREKRSALVTETVTRGLPPDAARAAGLDPSPPRKPSGVEWLGDIPAHWTTKRLGRLLRNNEDKVEPDEDARLPYVGMDQVESGTGRLLSIDPTFTPSGVSNRFAAGDILYGKLRPYLAKACCVDFDGLSSSELLALRATRDTDRRFLLYQLLADGFVGLMDAWSYGTKMPRTSWDLVRAVVVGVPALKEQRAIADYLDRETAKLDALVEKIETAIERLREYRSALITAAVTGKVDVRSARHPSPAGRGSANEARQS